MPDRRFSPGRVPDDGALPIPVTGGFDSDADGHADTVLTGDGVDLLVGTDIDGDGFADQVLRVGPDGVVRYGGAPHAGDAVLDGLAAGTDAGCIS